MKNIFLLFFTISLLSSCCFTSKNEEKKTYNIIISKDAKSATIRWIKSSDTTLNTTVVYGLSIDSAMILMANADGVIITGGDDVNPNQYNKPEYDKYCEGYDNYRDTLEIAMIKYAMANKIPLIGICRGHQIMNVANGGTIIPDIKTFLKIEESAHRTKGAKDSVHTINVVKNSWIEKQYPNNGNDIWVNTLHHQSVEVLASNFNIDAISPDGVIEAISAKDTTLFAVGIQWHPEFSKDKFSSVIAKYFLKAVRKQ